MTRGFDTDAGVLCTIEVASGLGRAACPGPVCPFWEPGGAVLAGRCAFDEIDLDRRAEVARELVRLRDELSSLQEDGAGAQLMHRYHRLLNTSDDG